MDSLEQDRRILQQILTDYARVPYAHGDIKTLTVFDKENDHYLLVNVGWDKKNRIHGTLVHVDIINGKFWIQRDGTEYGIACYLGDAGIPNDRIVLAWNPPEVRKLTDYAVA